QQDGDGTQRTSHVASHETSWQRANGRETPRGMLRKTFSRSVSHFTVPLLPPRSIEHLRIGRRGALGALGLVRPRSGFPVTGAEMNPSDLNRRTFHRLAGAALGGLLAGAAGVGLSAAEEKEEAKPKDPKKPLLLQEPHICRGLNQCKGHSVDKKNDCAGMGN